MIEHVIFDVGNVLVRWHPQRIIELSFPQEADTLALAKAVFGDPIWASLNEGKLSWLQAQQAYAQKFAWHDEQIKTLFYQITATQQLLVGTVDLMRRLKAAGYGIYGLTDNVEEIVHYLQLRDDFWAMFDGVVTSYQEGVLKPSPQIYQALQTRYGLNLSHSVFIDDMPANVEGAKAQGMHGIVFVDCGQCEAALRDLGLRF
ncbi:HAD family hydrolase [Vibrio stylophorae]|nr:HAD family phosphatase [Vibrio stylophorae]